MHPDGPDFYVDRRCATGLPFLLFRATPKGGRCAACRRFCRTESRGPRLAASRATKRLRPMGSARVSTQTFGGGSSTTQSTWAHGPKSNEISSPAEHSLGRHPPSRPFRCRNASASSLKPKAGNVIWPPTFSLKISARLVTLLATTQNGAGDMLLN